MPGQCPDHACGVLQQDEYRTEPDTPVQSVVPELDARSLCVSVPYTYDAIDHAKVTWIVAYEFPYRFDFPYIYENKPIDLSFQTTSELGWHRHFGPIEEFPIKRLYQIWPIFSGKF